MLERRQTEKRVRAERRGKASAVVRRAGCVHRSALCGGSARGVVQNGGGRGNYLVAVTAGTEEGVEGWDRDFERRARSALGGKQGKH